MDNKKTSTEASQARLAKHREAFERRRRWAAVKREVEEVATLHAAAVELNIREFLKRGHEFIGPLYRAADYSAHKLRDTFTQYEWAALTLGLEPNQDDPPLGPIPIQLRVADDMAQGYPRSQQHKQYSQRLHSFQLIVELMENNYMAGRLPYIKLGPRWISFLKVDLIFWNKSKLFPVADELLDTGGGRKFGRKHHQAFWDAEKTLRDKLNRHPTVNEIWEALDAMADEANPNAAIHSVHKYHLECWTEDGLKKKIKRESVMNWLRRQRKLSGQ